MNEKMFLLSPEEIGILLQSLQVMITHISITDTDSYMRDFKSKIQLLVEKILI